jgi:hypothetical protein
MELYKSFKLVDLRGICMEEQEKRKIAKKLKINYNKLNNMIDDLCFLKAKFSVNAHMMSLDEYRELRRLKNLLD